MKTILLSAALIPFLAVSSLAADDDDVTCRTELGKTSVAKVKTDTVTEADTIKPTITITVIPTETKQVGRWSTVTKFSSKTFTVTGRGGTDTVSTTSTLFKIATVKVTATATTTSTKTGTVKSTRTTAIPTTAGFRFISDTVNKESFAPVAGPRMFARNPHAPPLIKPGLKAFSFPNEVHCTKLRPNTNTRTIKKTGSPTTTTVSTMRTTVKTAIISTTTTLIPDDASVTKTFSSTMSVTTYSTIWTTSTKSATATKTSIIAGPTEYAACAEGNMFGPDFNSGGTGYYLTNVLNNGPGIPSDYNIVSNGADSAEECCASCMKFNGCETWIYRERNRNCFLLYHVMEDDEKCKSQKNHPNFFMSKKGADTGAGFVVGNGVCGFTYSGNIDGSLFSVDV
ncbi:hypothetical protein FLAG1_08746 [Fusarium langsethiae]|uniref:Apple domain-containing protein n=1 Tax=Fusarium langsethiae TaxID=179993 RepID=A0A0N0DCL6_FUSLA|nr:hypothetical protein FLAG1_08746 [Fusarium langsethiae]GKU17218.1 unnamed protein product [Fusarium langsethiae]